MAPVSSGLYFIILPFIHQSESESESNVKAQSTCSAVHLSVWFKSHLVFGQNLTHIVLFLKQLF